MHYEPSKKIKKGRLNQIEPTFADWIQPLPTAAEPTRFRDTMKSKESAELLAVEQTATDLLRRQNADESCECE